jgi:hypothetical protein
MIIIKMVSGAVMAVMVWVVGFMTSYLYAISAYHH